MDKEIEILSKKCGIITVKLVDPLSTIIDKIMGQIEGDANAVGIYYEAKSFSKPSNSSTVILFNTYDNNAIPWLKLNVTMESLLRSSFVSKISLYPINENLHGRFRTISLETISSNAKNIHDKNISYTALLLASAKVSVCNLVTGYTLVNNIITTLMGVNEFDPVESSKGIISSSLFSSPTYYSRQVGQEGDSFNGYVIQESQQEIGKLLAIFIDLFTTHEQFKTKVLSSNTIFCDSFDEFLKVEKPLKLPTIEDDSLIALRECIDDIVTSFNKDIPLTVDIGRLVKIYNDIVKDRKLKKIIVSGETTSRDAIITMPCNSNFPISDDITISNLCPNIESLTKRQLLDLLIYVDSLKDNFKESNARYANLSNKLAYEIAQRSKSSGK